MVYFMYESHSIFSGRREALPTGRAYNRDMQVSAFSGPRSLYARDCARVSSRRLNHVFINIDKRIRTNVNATRASYPDARSKKVSVSDKHKVYRVYNVTVPVDKDTGKDDFSVHNSLIESVKKKLKVQSKNLDPDSIRIVRKAFDSRKKNDKKWVYVVDVSIESIKGVKISERRGKIEIVRREGKNEGIDSTQTSISSRTKNPVVVIGSGPAGLFAALKIATAGIPVVVLERGRPVEDRGKDIGALFVRKSINAESNLCFGEGGAGTWSDGKLTTRIGRNDDPVRQVLNTMVMFGAPEEILYTGKPHLGTDRLIRLLQSFRSHLQSLGVDIKFSTKAEKLDLKGGKVTGVILDDGTEILTEACVLAIGHSARDMYKHLAVMGVPMKAKPFAMGFRIEHPQKIIDSLQYGNEDAERLVLKGKGPIPVADYKLTCNLDNNRGIYSFCMCPGGQIVPTSTNEAELCINGMSFSLRNSRWANSALVTTVSEDDWGQFDKEGPGLSGISLQKHIEKQAAILGGGNFVCPVQRVPDFLSDRISSGTLPSSSYRLGVKSASLHTLYSEDITDSIKKALQNFQEMKPGFICDDALLHAAETRTSSPVQILRDKDSLESIAVKGLYPAGEGAGYAGGIVSAAVDGLKIGEAISKKLTES